MDARELDNLSLVLGMLLTMILAGLTCWWCLLGSNTTGKLQNLSPILAVSALVR